MVPSSGAPDPPGCRPSDADGNFHGHFEEPAARLQIYGGTDAYIERITSSDIAFRHAGKLPGYPASHGSIRLPEHFRSAALGPEQYRRVGGSLPAMKSRRSRSRIRVSPRRSKPQTKPADAMVAAAPSGKYRTSREPRNCRESRDGMNQIGASKRAPPENMVQAMPTTATPGPGAGSSSAANRARCSCGRLQTDIEAPVTIAEPTPATLMSSPPCRIRKTAQPCDGAADDDPAADGRAPTARASAARMVSRETRGVRARIGSGADGGGRARSHRNAASGYRPYCRITGGGLGTYRLGPS